MHGGCALFGVAGKAVEVCFLFTVLMGPIRKQRGKGGGEEDAGEGPEGGRGEAEVGSGEEEGEGQEGEGEEVGEWENGGEGEVGVGRNRVMRRMTLKVEARPRLKVKKRKGRKESYDTEWAVRAEP